MNPDVITPVAPHSLLRDGLPVMKGNKMSETPFRSWMLTADDAIRVLVDDETSEETILRDTLEICLRDEEWHAHPDETELYPFVARCWYNPPCQAMLQSAMQFWPKERRATFFACLSPYFSPSHNGQEAASPPLLFSLQLTKDEKVKESYFNYCEVLNKHEHWRGSLQFNTFSNTTMIHKRPLLDQDEGDIGYWFATQYGVSGNAKEVRRTAIKTVAGWAQFDPLQQFIAELPTWDGIARVHTWLHSLCGADNTVLHQWIGRVLLLQMLARAIEPGCMARYVVIFRGAENTGKSQCVRVLGAPWSTTYDMSMDSKEAHMAVQGVWVAELSELDSLNRSQETRIKSFITQTHDDYIPKYANNSVHYARRTVFIGTTNEEQFLLGETGNTRFLPVDTGVFNLEALREQRDQLLAEALVLYNEHTEWWVVPSELQEVLDTAREQRRIENVYEETLRVWLDGEPDAQGQDIRYRDMTYWGDIAQHFLQATPKEWASSPLQKQIAAAMKLLGWVRGNQKRLDGKRQRPWYRPRVVTGKDEVSHDNTPPF